MNCFCGKRMVSVDHDPETVLTCPEDDSEHEQILIFDPTLGIMERHAS